MSQFAVRIEDLRKVYLLGETHQHTLSDRMANGLARLVGRGKHSTRAAREEFWALRGVSLEIREGEALGVIGGNGAGKSTLLKVLSRITLPTSGRAVVRGRLSSLLEVGTGFHPELTGRENVFLNGAILGMRKAEVERKFDEIVAFAGVEKFIDTPVKRYSSGMYVRLAFAVAAHLEPDVLIIDEVLAVGDAEFQSRCLGKMGEVASQGRTVLFVSHNMAAVRRLCSRVVWLDAGTIRADGVPEETISTYLADLDRGLGNSEFARSGRMYVEHGADDSGADASLVEVDIVDADGNPVDSVTTWSTFALRLTVRVRTAMRSFSPDVLITTEDGVVLVRTALSPDHGMPFSPEPGVYRFVCRFQQFPLTEGVYSVGVRLAIPGLQVLGRVEPAFRLRVGPSDVYGSGVAPSSKKCLVASQHGWLPPAKVAHFAADRSGGRDD